MAKAPKKAETKPKKPATTPAPPAPPAGEPAEMLVTREQLAAILGISGKRVQQLTQDGTMRKSGRTGYHLGESIQAFVAYKVASTEKANQSTSADNLRPESGRDRDQDRQAGARPHSAH